MNHPYRGRACSAAVAAIALAVAVLPLHMASAQNTQRLPKSAVLPTALPSSALPPVPPVASGYQAPQTAPPTAQIIGVTQEPFVGITLQNAIGMALLKDPNLAISASSVKIARYQIVEAKSPFDLRFHVEPTSNFSVQPPENAFFAGPGAPAGVNVEGTPLSAPGNIIQHQSGFQYGLGGETVNGLQYQAGIQQTRTFNNTIFNEYNPMYLATLQITLTQPLLKNAGMNEHKQQLKLAIVNADASADQALADASNTIAQVEDAYWSLVAAWRNVAIQEEALKEAVAQQASNVRLVKHGAAAPIEAVESSTQVSNFQDDVFSALQNVSELQNTLKSMIASDPGDAIWRANLVPTSGVLQLPSAPDLQMVIANALKNRPEVRQALDKRRLADIDRMYAHNQGLPQADIQATYQSNGFAGLLAPVPSFEQSLCVAQGFAACPTPPPTSQGIMAYAYHNMWAAYYPTFNIGFNVSFPLQNDFANGLKSQAGEEERQASILMQGVASRIGYEARNALQAYQSALSRLYATRHEREAAAQVYASELRKFHSGASTTFLVLQRQVQLAQARGQELQAQTDLNKAVVELQRVEGTLLGSNDVKLDTLGSKVLEP